MTISVANVTLEVDARAFLRYYDSFEPLARPSFAIYCEKCKQLCGARFDCACCENIGRSFAGSSRVKTSSKHDRIPIDAVLDALRKAAAA